MVNNWLGDGYVTRNVERNSSSVEGARATQNNRNFRGGPFRSEEDLIKVFTRVLRKSAPRGWALLREIDAGVGVADLVLVESHQAMQSELRLLRRIPLRLAPLLAPDVAGCLTSMEAFIQATGMSRATAHRTVGALVALRLAERAGENLQLRAVRSAPYRHLIAIEAKLRDWRRALTQAYRNRQFSSQSWVVLDAHYAVSDATVEAFSRAQVGLATCSSAGQLTILAHAETLPPSNLQRTWTAQAVVARSHRQVLRPLK